MRAVITSNLPASADHVWSLVKQSSTLLYVCRGMLGFAGAERFPVEWREGATEQTRLLFFGLIPAWQHRITFQEISDGKREQFTSEGGGLVPVWNHLIKVEQIDARTCRYTDDVEIRAGLLTPLIWGYAKVFYRYRQWRWSALLRRVGA